MSGESRATAASMQRAVLAVFTMNDPQDTVKLVTQLSMAFDDYEVGVQAPPPSSDLRTLPADSGLVQSLAGRNGPW